MRKVLYYLGILADTDVEWFVEQGTRKRLSAGTVLVQQSVPIDYLYIVLEGELAVRYQRGKGGSTNESPIAVLGAGEVVGELSLVDARPPSASVTAQTDSWVLAIPHIALNARLARDAAFAARFYRAVAFFLSDRFRATSRHLGYGDMQQEAPEEELAESTLDEISLAAVRFDDVLRRLRGEYDAARAS